MKKVTTLFARALMIATLMLPWTATEAAPGYFEASGNISELSYSRFTVRGTEYLVAPGSKLSSNDSKRRKFADFEKGDHIYFKGRVISDVYYVDIIYYETPDES